LAGITRCNISIIGRRKVLGVVVGDIHLLEGAHLDLYGTCKGNLILERSSTANIVGVLKGRIINRGGSISGPGIIANS
jgi:hypothetical protein